MNYCPECGHKLIYTGQQQDVATYHDHYVCGGGGCGAKWEETVDQQSGDTLHIAPVQTEEGGE